MKGKVQHGDHGRPPRRSVRDGVWQGGGVPGDHAIGPRAAATLAVGAVVPENSFTDGTSYRDLLVRFNQAVRVDHPDCVIDEQLERLHDAVSTGRMSPLVSAETPFVLLKFGPPSHGTVEVTVAQPLSEEWLQQQFSHLMDETSKVQAAFRARAK